MLAPVITGVSCKLAVNRGRFVFAALEAVPSGAAPSAVPTFDSIEKFDISSPGTRKRVRIFDRSIRIACIHPSMDSTFMLATSMTAAAKVLDTQSLSTVAEIPLPSSAGAACWLPDRSDRFALGVNTGNILLYDMRNVSCPFQTISLGSVVVGLDFVATSPPWAQEFESVCAGHALVVHAGTGLLLVGTSHHDCRRSLSSETEKVESFAVAAPALPFSRDPGMGSTAGTGVALVAYASANSRGQHFLRVQSTSLDEQPASCLVDFPMSRAKICSFWRSQPCICVGGCRSIHVLAGSLPAANGSRLQAETLALPGVLMDLRPFRHAGEATSLAGWGAGPSTAVSRPTVPSCLVSMTTGLSIVC